VRKDGTRFWANVVIDAIRSEDGVLLGYAKVTRDVTERRDAQQTLEEARSRFVQAQKMEAVGQLTGGIAHDFNNLLAVVLGNLDLARKRLPPDPKLKQLVENSIQAAERGATLTKRMLAFARRQDLETAPISVPDLVRDMADLLQRSIGPSIHISTQFPLRVAPALADANQLELALLNLVVNARDAMPDGGTITIAAREETILAGSGPGLKPGTYVCISVTDAGTGMDESTLARAVEPFFTTKGVGKGTGLGLSMIHGFADQSGGRLVLSSRPGVGTTAEIWLPVADAKPASVAEPESVDLRPAASAKRLSVLVVDDDSLVLMNTTAMLEDLGHRVLEATSGEQALRILRRENAVDIVVTDQLMPGMTGTQLIETIRSDHPDLPVILATGYADLSPAATVDVIRLGKPFLQRDLARALMAAVAPPEGQVLAFRAK
jgi:signal transduction histidine kinase